jgi:heme A synthase
MAELQRLERWARRTMALFLVAFTVFVVNVLLGKAEVALGWNVPYRFSDVGAFLSLLAAAGFFTVAALTSEAVVTAAKNE